VSQRAPKPGDGRREFTCPHIHLALFDAAELPFCLIDQV
jgi:hypothetical protein